MTATHRGDDARHWPGAQPTHHSWTGSLRARDLPDESAATARLISPPGGDLWSAPRSAVPVDGDLLESELLGSLAASTASDALHRTGASGTPPRTRPEPDRDRRPSPADGRRRHRSTGLALALAIAILIGLGFVARQLATPTTSDGSVGGQTGTGGGGPLQTTFPTANVSGTAGFVGSDDCPMRVTPDAGAAQAPPSGAPQCFFIG